MSATVIRLTPQQIDEWKLRRDIEEICRDKYRMMAADQNLGTCALGHGPVPPAKRGAYRLRSGYKKMALLALH